MSDAVKDLRWQGRAPAKINLFLRVLAREEGGYHQIETLYQALELADRIRLELVDQPGVRLEVEGVTPGALGPAEENLAVKGARVWLDAYQEEEGRELAGGASGLTISLEKRVPHGGGLGGGSSDAAAVLRGLESLHGHPLGTDRVVRLAAQLGADVGFFALDCPRALAWGRGDRLLPLPGLPAMGVLLAKPAFSISTPWAYQELARARMQTGATHPGGQLLELAALDSWDEVTAMGGNDFEAALHHQHPELAVLRGMLLEVGARMALLSGSGSTVFGLFSDPALMQDARALISQERPGTTLIATQTLA